MIHAKIHQTDSQHSLPRHLNGGLSGYFYHVNNLAIILRKLFAFTPYLKYLAAKSFATQKLTSAVRLDRSGLILNYSGGVTVEEKNQPSLAENSSLLRYHLEEV